MKIEISVRDEVSGAAEVTSISLEEYKHLGDDFGGYVADIVECSLKNHEIRAKALSK